MDATIIAQRNGVVLRTAQARDLPQVEVLTIQCYAPLQASYVAMLGEACYEAVRHQPELTWEERKTGQVRRLFREHPDWVWVLDRGGTLIGFVTFYLFPAQQYGHIDNNGVHPEEAGRGWGKFMYQHVLDYFRQSGLRFAHVDTGLDAAHDAARRAYEAVGFDRQVPIVEYWQDLSQRNPGSAPGE
jgi:ribosomal protein S18 acetylase RimI-like enzyme